MTIEQFITVLIKSRLSNQSEARELLAAFEDDCREKGINATADGFGDYVVSANRLTAWQCDKLRIGKWNGFYLDNYLILDQIEKDFESSSFKARDCRDGELVVLVVTPPKVSSGDIDYRVRPFAE